MKSPYHHANLFQISFFCALLGSIVTLGWLWGFQPWLQASVSAEIHPTGIPWINDRAECERSGRQWQNEVCWDSEHDPNF
ncbi:MAG: hypothetical protein MUF72_11920 [Elainella sp. Prado103]|jgi:hypothetical protein|nr:hypothetical protein [Elainella sp. Prado103]